MEEQRAWLAWFSSYSRRPLVPLPSPSTLLPLQLPCHPPTAGLLHRPLSSPPLVVSRSAPPGTASTLHVLACALLPSSAAGCLPLHLQPHRVTADAWPEAPRPGRSTTARNSALLSHSALSLVSASLCMQWASATAAAAPAPPTSSSTSTSRPFRHQLSSAAANAGSAGGGGASSSDGWRRSGGGWSARWLSDVTTYPLLGAVVFGGCILTAIVIRSHTRQLHPLQSNHQRLGPVSGCACAAALH